MCRIEGRDVGEEVEESWKKSLRKVAYYSGVEYEGEEKERE